MFVGEVTRVIAITIKTVSTLESFEVPIWDPLITEIQWFSGNDSDSESRAFGWLGKLSVVERSHFLPNLYKNSFDAQVTVPVRQHRQFRRVDFAVELIYERKIDPRQKLYVGMYIGIGVSAGNLEVVDAVLVYGMSGADDSPVPVAHHDIVAILKTV